MKTQKQPSESKSRPHTLWDNADKVFANYKHYVGNRDRFAVEYIDLLFISNYKGGNSVIVGSAEEINTKLESHRKLLRKIDSTFPNCRLNDLSSQQLTDLKTIMEEAFTVCEKKNIVGFRESYCSALYHFVFPELVPIIDRRVLIGLGIVNKLEQLNTYNNQVKLIKTHYPTLLTKLHERLKDTAKTLREIDKQYFILEIPTELVKRNVDKQADKN